MTPSLPNALGGGTLSGLFAGLLGTGGAIRGITLAAYDLQIETFIATSAIIDLGIDSTRSFVYYLNGYIKYESLYLIPLLGVASVIGTYVGKLILKRITQKQFKNIVLILVLLTGLITLWKVLFSHGN